MNELLLKIDNLNRHNLNFKIIENNFNELKINFKKKKTNLNFLINEFNKYYLNNYKSDSDRINIQLLSYEIAKYFERKKYYKVAFEYYLIGIKYYYPKSFLSLAIYFQCINYNKISFELIEIFNFLVKQIINTNNYYEELINFKKETIKLLLEIESFNIKKYSEILFNL